MSRGFIYGGKLKDDQLRKLVIAFFNKGEIFNIVEDLDYYKPDKGIPSNFKRKGRVFSEQGEIRWKQTGREFQVLLLSEKETNQPELKLKSENWKVEETRRRLQALNASHINPSFDQYPLEAKELLAFHYKKNGMVLQTRFRRFTK